MSQKKFNYQWMTYHLRHDANLVTDANGWVDIYSVAKLSPDYSHIHIDEIIEDILNHVKVSNKTRFAIKDEDECIYIRATNGHSIGLTDPIIQRVLQNHNFPWIIHVTTCDAWKKIQSYGGLSKMSRDYVHFAINHTHLRVYKKEDTVYLYLDINAMMHDGYELYITSNDVVLSMVDVPLRYLTEGSRPFIDT